MIWPLFLFMFLPSLNSNISWIFPFPRWPSLDGINSRDYHYPCGINKNNKSHKYTFVLHRPYVLRWKTIGKDYKGYRINLYDSSNHSIQIHPSSKSQEEFFNSNTNSITVSFKHPCDDCFIQIEKFTTSGPTYFSCADIDIHDKEVTTSNVTGGLCNEKLFGGDYCQLKVDCHDDLDCLNGGKCITQQKEVISMICVCQNGMFGDNCEMASIVNKYDACFNKDGPNSTNSWNYISYGIFNNGCYTQTVLSPNDFLYSRVTSDQVEVIIDTEVCGDITLGIRPSFFGIECRDWPEEFLGADMINYTEIGRNYLLDISSCMDILTASVSSDGHINIRDGFIYSNHTPLWDTQVGGNTSFSAAFGWKVAGRMLIMFRKPIKGLEPGLDHSFGSQMVGLFMKRSQSALGDNTYHDPPQDQITPGQTMTQSWPG